MRRIRSTTVVALLVLMVIAAALLAGCGGEKPAPQLTPEQLAAGVVGEDHPVDQEAATAQGCACHFAAE